MEHIHLPVQSGSIPFENYGTEIYRECIRTGTENKRGHPRSHLDDRILLSDFRMKR